MQESMGLNMTRLQQLKERLKQLESFKATELAMPVAMRAESYIGDLNESIKSIKVQITHVERHGEDIEVMNGGKFI